MRLSLSWNFLSSFLIIRSVFSDGHIDGLFALVSRVHLDTDIPTTPSDIAVVGVGFKVLFQNPLTHNYKKQRL